MATHSRPLAWGTPWTEERGGLPSAVAESFRTERVSTQPASGSVFAPPFPVRPSLHEICGGVNSINTCSPSSPRFHTAGWFCSATSLTETCLHPAPPRKLRKEREADPPGSLPGSHRSHRMAGRQGQKAHTPVVCLSNLTSTLPQHPGIIIRQEKVTSTRQDPKMAPSTPLVTPQSAPDRTRLTGKPSPSQASTRRGELTSFWETGPARLVRTSSTS